MLAVDLAPSLVGIARERIDASRLAGSLQFEVGDFSEARHGRFDYVVAMDSLIHYDARDIVRVLCELAPRTRRGVCLTFQPIRADQYPNVTLNGMLLQLCVDLIQHWDARGCSHAGDENNVHVHPLNLTELFASFAEPPGEVRIPRMTVCRNHPFVCDEKT